MRDNITYTSQNDIWVIKGMTWKGHVAYIHVYEKWILKSGWDSLKEETNWETRRQQIRLNFNFKKRCGLDSTGSGKGLVGASFKTLMKFSAHKSGEYFVSPNNYQLLRKDFVAWS
jgi:hypothetical protein